MLLLMMSLRFKDVRIGQGSRVKEKSLPFDATSHSLVHTSSHKRSHFHCPFSFSPELRGIVSNMLFGTVNQGPAFHIWFCNHICTKGQLKRESLYAISEHCITALTKVFYWSLIEQLCPSTGRKKSQTPLRVSRFSPDPSPFCHSDGGKLEAPMNVGSKCNVEWLFVPRLTA